MSNSGPIQAHQQLFHRQQWAHSWSSAVVVMNKNGPIHGYQQFVSWATLGLFKLISSFSINKNRPIYSYWQFASQTKMGPFVEIGRFPHEQQPAHSSSSATVLTCKNGPIHGHQQFFP
jgi:hypothetical protein